MDATLIIETISAFICICLLGLLYWRTHLIRQQLQQQNIYFELHKAQQQTFTEKLQQQQQSLNQEYHALKELLIEQHHHSVRTITATLQATQQQLLKEYGQQRTEFASQQVKNLANLQASLNNNFHHIRQQINETLSQNTSRIDQRLQEISGQVEQRLTDGFAKTTETFTNVLKRLALIDAAQQKITELSNNVIGLQEILADKRSRGAFGEVQLSALIRNMMPEEHFALQPTLSNGKRPDCMLYLPEPTGNTVIDAKFPLESYRIMSDPTLSDGDRKAAEQQFRQDVRKHIQDIASKYIIAHETAEGAMMFIPAEAVFAEIHGHYPDLLEYAYQHRVWLVSPTTMMAILTTARAVIKDAATRQQVHIIQEHLGYLAKDFQRFEKRMDNLAKHINLAHTDVNEVNVSARKISARFSKIEQVELSTAEALEQTPSLESAE